MRQREFYRIVLIVVIIVTLSTMIIGLKVVKDNPDLFETKIQPSAYKDYEH